MNSKPLLVAAALAAAALASACARPAVSGFAWKDGQGRELAFRQSASWEAGREGAFSAVRRLNRYTLEKPYAPGKGSCLELSVAAAPLGDAAPALGLSLYSPTERSKALAAASFPLRAAHSRLVLELPPGAIVSSLEVSLELPAPIPEAAIEAQVLGIAELPAFRGYEAGKEGAKVSSGFSYTMRGEESRLAIDRPFDGRERLALVLEYRASPNPGRIQIESLDRDGAPSSLSAIARPGQGRLLLGAEAFEEGCVSIRARLPSGIEPSAFYTAQLEARDFELADLGRVLRSRPRASGGDYDLYRWDLVPSVVVMDFADYATQDRYLKRLAFFVEKAGYRGSLQPDAVIGPLHGWNAHDYRPEDLAAFFREAAAKGFPLNREELALELLLAERGVLVGSGKGIEAGKGALISIARESPPYLRRTFLVHESTHAIFFADPEYRAFVQAEWKAMGKEERWFWKRYFQWMVYDTSSEYLMANEYQAYLLQQPLRKVEEYFTRNLPANLLVPEVLEREPELRSKVEAYMERYGSSFARRAATLDAWLARKYGLAAGRTYSVE
ncbi:MAG TPA: hypothetical protein P5133_10205 [Spirochaetia bacterium]|nr:hypothetical protein [Spirochaetia bacterium]HRZ65291.1 hypothetical protein [Spirochaetia bacterium]